jgi:hypothetical protein
MNRVTSVLAMAGRKQTDDSAAKRAALREVTSTSKALRTHDKKGEGLREKRNQAIVKASKHATATEISEASEIKQSYISRVIRSGGKPGSGSALDRSRGGEPVGA